MEETKAQGESNAKPQNTSNDGSRRKKPPRSGTAHNATEEHLERKRFSILQVLGFIVSALLVIGPLLWFIFDRESSIKEKVLQLESTVNMVKEVNTIKYERLEKDVESLKSDIKELKEAASKPIKK